MAAKRRSANNADSKATIIITLVFFVLLSIGALVWGYFGYDGQSQYVDKLKKLQADITAEKKEQDWQRLQSLFYKINAGFAKEDTDIADYTPLRERYNTSPASLVGEGQRAQTEKAAIDELIAKLEKEPAQGGLGKDPIKNKTTLTAQVAKLKQENENLTKLRVADQQAKEKALQGEQEAAAALEKARKKFDGDFAAIQQEMAKVKAAKSDEFIDIQGKFDQSQKEKVEIKDAGAKREKDLKDQLASFEKTKADQDLKIKKLEDQRKTVLVEDYDHPKGSIMTVDRTGNTVYIDLGSADRVKEGLTFSIAGKSTNGKANSKIKGALEVVSVMGPHLAKARVTDVVDGYRDPVLNGDLLFNLAWSPTMRERVAIAGLVDLTGDGRDSTQELIKNLQKQNIDVDAYLDLKDLAIKGRGMSLQTTYLILGPTPDFDLTAQLKDGDPRSDRKKEIVAKMADMNAEADKLGIEKIPVRRFLAKIGYRLPRGAQTSTTTANYDLPRGVSSGAAPGGAAAAAAGAIDKETPKEEKAK